MRGFCGDEGTGLSHEDEQRGLPDVCAFSGHVGACEYEEVGVFVTEFDIVRYEFGAESFCEDGVFAFCDEQFWAGGDFGSDVVSFFGEVGEGGEAVAGGGGVGEVLQAGDVLCGLGAKLVEYCGFEFEGLFVCGEDLCFVVFEFFGDVSFGVFDCLFSDVVGGYFFGGGV